MLFRSVGQEAGGIGAGAATPDHRGFQLAVAPQQAHLAVGVGRVVAHADQLIPQQGRADAFAQDSVPAVAHQVPFDSARALKDIAAICAIGTRVSGSPGMQKQQEMLEKHFKAQGLEVSFQKFQATRKSTRTTVEMANLVARINPEKTSRVVICTHYDTRPRADQETDRAKRDTPFLSANDGASGVAFLMELARHAKIGRAHV